MKKNKLAQSKMESKPESKFKKPESKPESKFKKPFSYYKLIIYSLLFVVLLLPIVIVLSQTLNPDDGIQIPKSGIPSLPLDYPYINPTERCTVHNKTTAVTYMVPYRTAMEWAAFKGFTAKNNSVISVSCEAPCVPKTCADKTGLANINGGYNCGKYLNDGCNGTINCLDNCAVGEVCSNGAINSACDNGDLSQCQGNFQGHCETDNGCIPIIDFAEIDANKHGRMGCLLSGPYQYSYEACGSYQEVPWNNSAIYFRGQYCYVGDGSGMGMTDCFTYFLNDGPQGYNFYKVSDGEHFPYTSYFSTVNNSFVACSAGDGGTPGCSSPCCNDDCWNTCIINNDENYCFDICCLEQQT